MRVTNQYIGIRSYMLIVISYTLIAGCPEYLSFKFQVSSFKLKKISNL